MTSKAQKLKRRKAANEIRAQSAVMADAKPSLVPRPVVRTGAGAKAIRPTAERMAKGAFRLPTGLGMQKMPAVDEAHDTVAALHRAGLITDAQEATARDWQSLKASIRAELAINVGRSCLDFSPAGHDDGDGDADLMRRWLMIEAELGSFKTGCLDWTCVLGHPPGNLGWFRASLDAFQGC